MCYRFGYEQRAEAGYRQLTPLEMFDDIQET